MSTLMMHEHSLEPIDCTS